MSQKKKTPSEATAPGWRIPGNVQDDFKRWCDLLKLSYEAECSASLFLWPRLPADIREWAKFAVSGDADFGTEFWRVFSASLETAVSELKKRRRERDQRDDPGES